MNTWACEAVRDGIANFLLLLKKNKGYIMDNLNNFAVRAHSYACSLPCPLCFSWISFFPDHLLLWLTKSKVLQDHITYTHTHTHCHSCVIYYKRNPSLSWLKVSVQLSMYMSSPYPGGQTVSLMTNDALSAICKDNCGKKDPRSVQRVLKIK